MTAPCPICGETDTDAFRIPVGNGVSEWWHHPCLEGMEYNLIELCGNEADAVRYDEIGSGNADWHVESVRETLDSDEVTDLTVEKEAERWAGLYSLEDLDREIAECAEELDRIAAAHGADTYSGARLADNLRYTYAHGQDYDSVTERVEYWLVDSIAVSLRDA